MIHVSSICWFINTQHFLLTLCYVLWLFHSDIYRSLTKSSYILILKDFLNLFVFGWKAEGKRETHMHRYTHNLSLLVHFLIACSRWDLARPKPETCNLLWVSCVGDRDLSMWAITHIQDSAWAGSCSPKWSWDLNQGPPSEDADTPRGHLCCFL